MQQSLVFFVAGCILIGISILIFVVGILSASTLPTFVKQGKLLVFVLGIGCFVIAADFMLVSQNHIR